MLPPPLASSSLESKFWVGEKRVGDLADSVFRFCLDYGGITVADEAEHRSRRAAAELAAVGRQRSDLRLHSTVKGAMILGPRFVAWSSWLQVVGLPDHTDGASSYLGFLHLSGF